MLGELNDELDKAMVDLFGVDETFDVDHGVSLDEGHDDAVSVRVVRGSVWGSLACTERT